MWYIGMLVFMFVVGVTMGSQASAKTAEEQKEDVMAVRLYLGQQIPLADLPEGNIVLSQEHVIEISKQHMARAVGKGTVRISVDTGKKTIPYADVEVRENELLAGLSFHEQSFEAKLLGAGAFTLPIPEFQSMTCEWSSADESIATVTKEGIVTPVRPGVVNLTVQVTDSYGGSYTYRIPIRILEVKFSVSKCNLAKGCQTTLSVLASAGNPVVYKTMDSSIVSLVSFDAAGVTIKAKKVGTTTVLGAVDGVEFQCKISVTNPTIKTQYGFYQKKKTLTISVKGLNAKSVPVYSSNDPAVATVSKKGTVKTLKYGSAVISCQVDGKTLNYYLAVSTKTAVKAMRYGYKQVGKKKYSQARRMSKNYYDCSSFVYRIYRVAGKYLVRKAKWAPVAAEIAHYYVRKGKQIKASKTYDPKKLRPGDLICFGGSKARRNGRYKRIYHIALYIGNGKTMESSSTYNNVVIRDRGTIEKSDVPVVVRP